MTGERDIRVPVLLLIPQNPTDRKHAVAVMISQSGKSQFLKEQAETVSALLQEGVAVCLPDLRGTGETRPGNGRERQSWATSISATELMLGQTLLGSRLKDLRSLLAYLRGRPDFDPRRMAVWGDSSAKVNPPGRNLRVPRGIDNSPDQAEPGGPLLALFAGLFEEDLAAVVLAEGGLVSWRSMLDSEFLYVPHDAVIPGALAVGDTPDIAAALAPQPLWISGLVDGQNRRVAQSAAEKTYAKTKSAFGEAKSSNEFHLQADAPDRAKAIVPWLVGAIEIAKGFAHVLRWASRCSLRSRRRSFLLRPLSDSGSRGGSARSCGVFPLEVSGCSSAEADGAGCGSGWLAGFVSIDLGAGVLAGGFAG